MSIRLSSAVVFALCAAIGCGRIDYDPVQALVASGNDSTPFGGARADGVAFLGGNAVLERLPTFVVADARLPRAASAPAACARADKSVVVAGGSGAFLAVDGCSRDVQVYHRDGSISTITDELPVASQGLGLVWTRDAIHSVMGFCGGTPEEERTVYRHGEGMAPAVVGLFPDGAYHFASGVVVDAAGTETILTAGGYGSGPLLDLLQAMSPSDGTSRHLDVTLPTHRCLAAGAAVGDTLYVIGGSTHTDCVPPATSTAVTLTDEIVAVNVRPDRARVVGHLPEPVAAACAVARADGTIAVFGGLRYVGDGAGGFRREASATVYRFDPATGAVTAHPAALPTPLAAMGCARTPDDRTLLFGGAGPSGTTTDAILLFEPYAASGTVTGALDAGTAGVRWLGLTAEMSAGTGTTIAFAVRVREDPTWPDATSGWVGVEAGVAFPAAVPRGRYLEWRASLTSDSLSATPSIHRVELSYTAGD